MTHCHCVAVGAIPTYPAMFDESPFEDPYKPSAKHCQICGNKMRKLDNRQWLCDECGAVTQG
jgi:hypothetical protein